jgi:hypothetical protein
VTAEPFLTTVIVVGVLLWLLGSRSQGRTKRSIEPVLGRVARALDGELSTEPLELRFEVEGAPARLRAESECAVLRIDLSCLRRFETVRELCHRWSTKGPTLEALAALRDHPYAPETLRLRRRELCISVGRIPTARRILGCADFARKLLPLLVQASLEASRPRQPYR